MSNSGRQIGKDVFGWGKRAKPYLFVLVKPEPWRERLEQRGAHIHLGHDLVRVVVDVQELDDRWGLPVVVVQAVGGVLQVP